MLCLSVCLSVCYIIYILEGQEQISIILILLLTGRNFGR